MPIESSQTFQKEILNQERSREKQKTYEVILLDEDHGKEGPYRYSWDILNQYFS